MKKIGRIVIVLVLMVIIFTINGQASEVSRIYLPLVVQDVCRGPATVMGRLLSEEVGLPVRLAEVFGNVYVLDLAYSPGTDSDYEGYFIFEEVEPLEYVIVIGNPLAEYQIVLTDDGESAKVWSVESCKTLDVGEIFTEVNNLW